MSKKERQDALKNLRNIKKGKEKRQYQLPEEERIYDEINEEDYNENYDTFIEGTYGLDDDPVLGDEYDDPVPADTGDGANSRKRRRKLDASIPTTRITQLITPSYQPKPKRQKTDTKDLDELFSEELGVINEAETPFDAEEKKGKENEKPKTTSTISNSATTTTTTISTVSTTTTTSTLASTVTTTSLSTLNPKTGPNSDLNIKSTLNLKVAPKAATQPATSPQLITKKLNTGAGDLPTVSKETWAAVSQSSKMDLDVSTPSYNSTPTMPPLTKEKSLVMYWIDMDEDRQKGLIYLYGKVWFEKYRKFRSCCVIVEGNERTIYVAPRQYLQIQNSAAGKDAPPPDKEPVSMNDVVAEFGTVCAQAGITTLKSKPVKRNYGFDQEGVQRGENEFLKVIYGYDLPELPASAYSGKTYSHVFGAKTSSLENFIIQRRIMGPRWLEIKNVKQSKNTITWCAFECSVVSPKDVSVLSGESEYMRPPPPLIAMSIKVQVVMEDANTSEIIAISAVVHESVNTTGPTMNSESVSSTLFIRKTKSVPIPVDFQSKIDFQVNIEGNERALLNSFLTRLLLVDPDIVVGHNFMGFDLDILLHRMRALNTVHWSRLGRLNRSKMPHLSSGATGGEPSFAERTIMAGRLICDTYLCAKEFVKAKNYKLSTLSESQLGITKEDLEPEKALQMFGSTDTLIDLCKLVLVDASLGLKLMFKLNLIPLTRQLTELCGNRWSRSLTGARAERIDFLLLHQFYNQKPKFVLPDKVQMGGKAEQNTGGKEKPKYSGGLVLDPKIGFYDKYILLLDFNSLYPSIIQEYNICFTTIPRSKDEKGNWREVVPPADLKNKGILPKVIRTLVQSRRAVKDQIKKETDHTRKAQLDVHQLAIKLVANSMYGCLGFKSSRFYALPLAQLITAKGREALMSAASTATKQVGLDIIYGDTDSIMLNTRSKDLKEVKKKAMEVKEAINKSYKDLEIELDGIFASMLLLKKKKYAALLATELPDGTVSTHRQMKGLDMVRRDWCTLSADMGSDILDQVLKENSLREDLLQSLHNYLREKATQIRQGSIPLEKYIITKSITKQPELYNDKLQLPHVQVALALKRAGKKIQPGDFIQYIICKGDKPVPQRAFAPEQVEKDKLEVDTEWYMANQIFPTTSRLLSPIEGTDSALVAMCLGLDPNKMTKSVVRDPTEEIRISFTLQNDLAKYRDVNKLILHCGKCKTLQEEFQGVYINIDAQQNNNVTNLQLCDMLFKGLTCSTCTKKINSELIKNKVFMLIRSIQKQYYSGVQTCSKCSSITKQINLTEGKYLCPRSDCNGRLKPQCNETSLFLQISYLRDLFDVDAALNKMAHVPETTKTELKNLLDKKYQEQLDIYSTILQEIDKFALSHSNYFKIPVSKLGSYLFQDQ